MIYFWSDLHFNHNKDFIWESRGFSSIEEHNEILVERYNSTVTPEDTVYILGDLTMGPVLDDIWLPRLNGEVHFIRGNHDTDNRIDRYKELGFIDEGYATLLKYRKTRLYLSHFPTLVSTKNGTTLGIHGHTHSQSFIEYNSFNVAVDAIGKPIPIEEILDSRCKLDLNSFLEVNS